MNKRDEVAELFFEMDKAVSWYLKSTEMINREYGFSDGQIKNRDKVSEYESRLLKVRRNRDEKIRKLVNRLNDMTAKFNVDKNFCERYLSAPPKNFPRYVVTGELTARYKNFAQQFPLVWRLPLSRSLCVEEKDANFLLQVMFRLLFAMPPGLCQFHVYDPCHFGNSVDRFDILRNLEQVFPDKNFLCDAKEFKTLLDELNADFIRMRQEIFPEQNCRTWSEFNQRMCNNPRKQLPYKVLVCFDLPETCNLEHLTALKRLSDEGANFGFLLMFSYQPEALLEKKIPFDGTIDSYQNAPASAVFKKLYKNSAPLENSFTCLNELSGLNFLRVTEKLFSPIEAHVMEKFLIKWRDMLSKKNLKPIDFDELIGSGKFFDSKSLDGLEIPLGLQIQNNEILKLPVSDMPPHTLIAGMTGSGKSNLLHVLICNACARYSPEELNFYLLDFKQGVEFATYASPTLPHAKLVATRANAFYAQTVLEHLNSEIERRNELFKTFDCKDYRAYREKNPGAKLPRIILLIDEFQRLFEADGNQTMKLLTNLTKQGRSSGIHLIFATQSFKGLGDSTFTGSFSKIKNQFGARIALRCSVEDSADILGQNNEAASELTIGFAILNVGGNVKSNQKFAVPEAKAEAVKETLRTLAKISAGKSVQTKIFDGQTLPTFPSEDEFCTDAAKILLGHCLDYDGENFSVELTDKPEQNLLFCGRVESFFSCVLKFASVTKFFEEFVYVGKKPPEKFVAFETPQAFFDAVKDSRFDRRRLIILDGCEFPKISFPQKPSEQQEFFGFWQELSEHGSHAFAFYETFGRLKSSNLDYAKLFAHRVARDLSPTNIRDFGGVSLNNKFVDVEFNAAYLYSERMTCFQPFAEN